MQEDQLDKFMQMRATQSPTEGETDREERERMIQLCKDWWNSPNGRKSIKNSFYPSEKFKEVENDKL